MILKFYGFKLKLLIVYFKFEIVIFGDCYLYCIVIYVIINGIF